MRHGITFYTTPVWLSRRAAPSFTLHVGLFCPAQRLEGGPGERGPSSPHSTVRPSVLLSARAEAREELRNLVTTHTARRPTGERTNEQLSRSRKLSERPTDRPTHRASEQAVLTRSAKAPLASAAFLFLALPAILGCSVTLARSLFLSSLSHPYPLA